MHRLVMPVMLSDGRSSGHVGAPYNCLQSFHKVLTESTLPGRSSARVIGKITEATALPCGRRGEQEPVRVQEMTSQSLEHFRTRLPTLQDPIHT